MGLSLNEYCARMLATPGSRVGGPAADAIERAAAVASDALVGVVAFGSWSRDEAGTGSDVDLLVVVEREEATIRSLYRRWDAEPPLRWDSRRVEPHFVYLLEADERVSGMWAEIAIDGIVLFEQGLRISRRLVELRREIAAGRFVRRRAHGQPYWVEAA